MTEPGFAPFPGHSADAIPSHKPMRPGPVTMLAHAYVRRAKLTAAACVLLSVCGTAVVAQKAWTSYETRQAVVIDASAVSRNGHLTADKVISESSGKETILADARAAARKASKIAGELGTGSEAVLVERRLAAVEKLVSEDSLDEAENVIRSIEGITGELEARRANASLLTAARDPDAVPANMPAPAEPAAAKAADAIAAIESRLSAVGADVSADLEIRIADGDGVKSGFWRTMDGHDQHFVIVEAIDGTGKPYGWNVRDMDTGYLSRVDRWAVWVSADEFARLSAEKAISGSLANTVAGTKKPGSARIEWKVATDGRALADWKEDAE